jgi:hypothetical protein
MYVKKKRGCDRFVGSRARYERAAARRVMRSAVGLLLQSSIALALAMATAGRAGGLRQVLHTGAGVARRQAYHDSRADDRAVLEEVDVEAVLCAESATQKIVRVEAATIVVEAEGANYSPVVKRESKKQRRARQQEKAREQQQAAATALQNGGGNGRTEAADEAQPEAVVVEGEVEGAEPRPEVAGRLTNALADALADEEDDGDAGEEEVVAAPLLDEHGPNLSDALRYVRRRLKQYLDEQAASGKTVALVRGARGLYPTMQWTIQFGKWLATTRIRKSKADGWDEKAWNDKYQQRKTKGKDTYYVMLQHIKNHLWRELWPAMLDGAEATQYWRVVTKQTMAMFDGGGGGMLAAATLVEKKATRAAQQAQKSAVEVAAAGLEARKETMGMLRAATAKPCTKEHLYQVGEYQLQDAFLSDPFEVNASYVMNAYVCFARTTGCRPGMAVNDVKDSDDPAGHWYELPPLQMGSLAISPERLRQVVESTTSADVEMLLRMEISFERKKGEYFACYDFGTAITPDSDEMVRIGTLAMIRLQLVTASYAACYAKLSEAQAAALRHDVADPEGFGGLALERTGYDSWGALVAACRESGWALDPAAYDRPLFPGVDEKTGKFLFTESFEVQRLCNTLISTGRKLGFNKHGVGAWSLRKDATEVVAKSGYS